jgi:cytochrome c5
VIDPRSLFAVATSALLVGRAAVAFEAVTLEDYSGSELFDRFCASCHGSEARGDGPVSRSLNVAVPNLTTIELRYGEFPAAKIRDVIDGRGIDTHAHGTRTMPVWGYELWLADDAITRLVEYLRSVQQRAGDNAPPGRSARR